MKKILKKVGWAVLAILPMIVSIKAQYRIAFIVARKMIASIDYSNFETLEQQILDITAASAAMAVLAYHVIALVGFGIWYYFGCGRSKPQRPSKVFSGKTFLATLLIGLLMCISANAFLLAAQYIVPDVIQQYEELMERAGIGTNPVVIFVSVLVAPIGEEILCRGVTFYYVKKLVAGMKNHRAAFWIANALQALMFGIMHGNLVQGTYAFFLGLGLGWLSSRYNSLYPAMLAHFVVNFTSTFIAGFLFGVIPEAFPVYLLVMVVGIVGIVLLVRREDKRAAVPVWGNVPESTAGNMESTDSGREGRTCGTEALSESFEGMD